MVSSKFILNRIKEEINKTKVIGETNGKIP